MRHPGPVTTVPTLIESDRSMPEDAPTSQDAPEDTPTLLRAEILGDLWIRYSQDPTFEDFMRYNDLGLPLAYALGAGIIDLNPRVEAFVTETWDLLLETLERDDTGFADLDDLLEPSDG
jgi:hypothetical protein